MASFTVLESFQFRGEIRREGSTLVIAPADLKAEIALGKHPDTNRPFSGLLNHCVPADDEAENMVEGSGCKPPAPVEEMTPEAEEKEKKAILAEMQGLGAFCNPMWKLSRMRKELLKAQKEKPAEPIKRDPFIKPAERV